MIGRKVTNRELILLFSTTLLFIEVEREIFVPRTINQEKRRKVIRKIMLISSS